MHCPGTADTRVMDSKRRVPDVWFQLPVERFGNTMAVELLAGNRSSGIDSVVLVR